jgi:pSer/pThr/pTyr-binding forkhead associated (FHA) protein
LGKRLIIQHGERVTHHELTDRALVIGRDPGCDLFFADPKLSRRHAKLESHAEGVKLTDLGSRNGSWVNCERVDAQWLSSNDRIRMGRLQITVEEEVPSGAPPAPGGDDATVVLPEGLTAEDAGRTVQMNRVDPSNERTAERERAGETVIFTRDAPGPEPERTVVVSRTSSPGDDSGTVIFTPPHRDSSYEPTRAASRAEAPPTLEVEAHIGSNESPAAPTAVGSMEPRTVESLVARPSGRVDRRPVLITLAASAAAYLLIAVPLVLWTRGSLRDESMARGRALLDLLVLQNEAVWAIGDHPSASVSSVEQRDGVEEALILDTEGRVLAPGGRSAERHETLPGTSKKLSEIDGYYLQSAGGGAVIFARPVAHGGERVGTAFLRYATAGLAEAPWISVLLFLGLLVLAGGAWWGACYLPPSAPDTETTLAESQESTLSDIQASE